jgi:hypothetical protein
MVARMEGGSTMTAAAELPARALTLDDVTRLAENDITHTFELIQGNLVIRPPSDCSDQRIRVGLSRWLVGHGFRGRVNVATGCAYGLGQS